MKVLHVLNSNRFSGAENVACQIIHMFRQDKGVEMAYCSPDGPIRQALAERDIEFVPLQAATLSEIKRAIAEYKPTLIHAHDMRASFLVSLACGKIPYISHIHNNGFDSRKPTPKAILYRLAAAKARHIFWVSCAALEGYCFRSGVQKKSSVLYNVIDMEQLRTKAMQADRQDAYDIVFLGRMTDAKDPHRLVGVLQRCLEQESSLTAALIGSGEMEQEVQDELRRRGMTERVRFLGFMDNPYGILKNAKAMVMTSRWEGLPMCALEAMALGVPIVSTPTDGLRELVVSGETGYLSHKDEELAGHLVEIVKNEETRKMLSEETLRKIRGLMDLEKYKQTLLGVYR